MKCLSYMLFLMLSFAACTHAQDAPATPPFKITIRAASPNVGPGNDVWVELTIENMTNSIVDLNSSFDDMTLADPNFVVEVTDDRGNPVPRRKFPHQELAGGHPVSRTLAPGASMTAREPVGRLFDMSKTGTYVVQVSGPITEDKNVGTVKSNKITITVAIGGTR